MTRLELSLSIATTAGIFLVACCFLAAYLYYKRTIPAVPLRLRYLLTTLRGLVFSLVCLLLFEPLIRVIHTTMDSPVLAVLIDNSRSMRLADNSGDRSQTARTVLDRVAGMRLAGEGDRRWFLFGSSLREAAGVPDSLSYQDEVTDITAALSGLSAHRELQNIRAVLLLSDGSSNSGENPLYAASALGIPVFTVGIGDSSYPTDVAITNVVTNHQVYENTEVPVDVMIRSSGFEGKVVEVSLSDGGNVLDRKRVQLGAGTREYSVNLTYTPKGEGTRKFTVRASRLEGELTTENNRTSFFARILKGKLHVLIIGGAPSTDLVVVKQTLQELDQFSVNSRTQRFPSGFYEGDLTQSAVDSADCLLLIGFPTERTPAEYTGLVRRAVERKRIPVLFLGGRSLDASRLQELGPVVPVVPVSASASEDLAFMIPAESQRTHPLLAPGGAGATVWDRLPPVFKSGTVYRTRPEATTLAHPRIQGVTLPEPVIALRNINRNKGVALVTYGIWRWRLMAQGDPATEDHLASFLATTIRWLTTREEERNVRARTTKDFFTEGEPVEFIGEVYDMTARPVENADLRVQLVEDGTEVLLTPVGNGRYEGLLHGVSVGEHSFTARAFAAGNPLGDDRSRFSVGEQNLEFQDPRMNIDLLRQLADRTGGAFMMPAETGRLEAVLSGLPSFEPRNTEHTTDFELWNRTFVLVAMLALLALEWFLRKRNGMI
jgi:hypothetical protein